MGRNFLLLILCSTCIFVSTTNANETFWGDVNQDGNVNLEDVILGLQLVSGSSPAIPPILDGIDVGQDAQIGLPEILYALQATRQGKLTDQPYLADDFTNASTIETELFGPHPSTIEIRQVRLVPNVHNGGWNVLIFYNTGYLTDAQLISFNTKDKIINRQTAGLSYYNRNFIENSFDIKAIPDLRQNVYRYRDIAVIPMNTRYQGFGFLTYDIQNNVFNPIELIDHPDNYNNNHGGFKKIATTFYNGIIRVFGFWKGNVRYEDGNPVYDGAGYKTLEYNPLTQEISYSLVTPPVGVSASSEYQTSKMCNTGDWMVTAVGGDPWVMMAYNYKTKVWKRNLLTISDTNAYYSIYNIGLLKNGSCYYVSNKDQPNSRGWLFKDGELTEIEVMEQHGENGYLAQLAEAGVERYDIIKDRIGLGQSLDSSVLTSEIPDKIDVVAGKPSIGDNVANISWTDLSGNEEFVEATVNRIPQPYKIIESSGDWLYGTDDGYGNPVFYNSKTNQTKYFQNYGSVYFLKTIGDKVYTAGYPNFKLREYDLSDPTDITYKDLGVDNSVKTHMPMAGIEEGADGNVYISGHYWRNRTGGGIAWYNPTTGERQGIPFDTYRPFWMASILDGNYMILSVKEENGKLMIFDVFSKEYTIHSIPGGIFPGYIQGVGNHIVGLGSQNGKGLIYRYDPLNKTVIWSKAVPYGPNIGFSDNKHRNVQYRYDGTRYFYTTAGGILLKVDVNTGFVEVLGKSPVDKGLTIMNGKIYFAGANGFLEAKLTN